MKLTPAQEELFARNRDSHVKLVQETKDILDEEITGLIEDLQSGNAVSAALRMHGLASRLQTNGVGFAKLAEAYQITALNPASAERELEAAKKAEEFQTLFDQAIAGGGIKKPVN